MIIIHCYDFPSARIKPNERVKDMPFDKPSMTTRPDKSVTEKRKVPGLTIDVSVDTDNLSVKLRAIAKHATAWLKSWMRLTRGKSYNCC